MEKQINWMPVEVQHLQDKIVELKGQEFYGRSLGSKIKELFDIGKIIKILNNDRKIKKHEEVNIGEIHWINFKK